MSENLKKFLELLAGDSELEKKALACNEMGEEKGKEAMIALAKECGIALTAADFEKKEEPASRELSDDELDAVAGGFDNNTCFCIAGGGGGGVDSKDGKKYGCACVLYGQGGDGSIKDFNCTCVGCGSGDNANNAFLHD